MKFRIESLSLFFKKEEVTQTFEAVTYFWGQMGAGKSSIAKMIDYCLGADVELSPAMQSEFVSAALILELATTTLHLERERDSSSVLAMWDQGDEKLQLILPARAAAGIVLPGTEVETLSDLIFHLSGLVPPLVRRSKKRDDSERGRLSVRDLLWYCYLDQDEIDSSFFHLQHGADIFRQLKSRDVLRYIIGFHDERVAELEAELDRIRGERLGAAATIDSLRQALQQVGIESEIELAARAEAMEARARLLQREIAALRQATLDASTQHAADTLRTEARSLSEELGELENAAVEIQQRADHDRRHLNELETLSVKFKRSLSARAVLGGVSFHSCPRCAQALPHRESDECPVCGQPDTLDTPDPQETALVERDLRARSVELRDILQKHAVALEKNRRDQFDLRARKDRVERERNEALAAYDSAYLSTILSKERERAALQQEIASLATLARFPQLLESERERLAKLAGEETRVRTLWREAKDAAEGDDANLNDLKGLFLDCLLRASVPGISERDTVDIPRTNFFPVIRSDDVAESTETSFTTLSSGGKKTLFKCCFAVALHRLAVKLGAPLPELLIIDSPMKNISERENKEQFLSFYGMVYDLQQTELRDTQIVLIDKEFTAPSRKPGRVLSRHMKPNDPENPPLIPYYRGN